MKIENVIAQKHSVMASLLSRPGIMTEFENWCRTSLPMSPRLSVDESTMKGIVGAISASAVVYWEAPIWNAAGKGSADAFGDNLFDRSLFGPLSDAVPQWWVVGGERGTIVRFPVSKQIDTKLPDVPLAILGFLLQTRTIKDITELWALMVSRPIDDDDNGIILRFIPLIVQGAEQEIAHEWLARLAFMRLPFVSVERRTPPRADRRRAEREGREIPAVNVVTLRKAAPLDEPNGQRDVDWQHSWIVSGHWRKQWYPSESAHKPVYISPYLKGDPSKPLLSRPVAYKVVR